MYADLICAKEARSDLSYSINKHVRCMLHDVLILMRLTIPCGQAGEWCLPKTGSIGLDSRPTKASLDQLCDPCTLKHYRIMMRIFMMMMDGEGGGSPDRMLSAMMAAMCSKDKDGSYCALQTQFQSMFGDEESAGPPASAMCSLCGKKIMQGMAKAGGWSAAFAMRYLACSVCD